MSPEPQTLNPQTPYSNKPKSRQLQFFLSPIINACKPFASRQGRLPEKITHSKEDIWDEPEAMEASGEFQVWSGATIYASSYMLGHACMHERMDGWVGGWMDGWMDGWMNLYIVTQVFTCG